MASIEDRWMKQARDPETKAKLFDSDEKPIMIRTARYGTGKRYRVKYLDPDKKERSRSFPDGKYTLAKNFKIKMENDVLAGVYRDPKAGELLAEEWAVTYLKGRSQDASSQSTVGSLFKCQIFPFMGRKALKDIDDTALREWKHWMSTVSKISANYQVDCWNNFSAMLDAAVAAEKILSNPCKSKTVSSPTRITRLITPWTERKLQAIEAALPEKYKIGTVLGGGLGLRVGEIHAFSPDFIDRKRMTYRCARQIISRPGPLQFKLPKGHKERQVPISKGVLQRIDAYMVQYPPVSVTLPWAEQDGQEFMTVRLLLTTATNRPWWSKDWAATIWKPAFVTADELYEDQVDGTHALRHLYASHMLAQGVNIKELAAFLGHTDEAFTLRKYVHLLPTSHDRARAAADAMFPPGRGGTQAKPSRMRLSQTSRSRPSGTSRRVAGRSQRTRTAGH